MVVHGSKITMEQPKLSGFTRDSRAYNLTADSAAQDLTKPDIMELSNISAQVQMKDKSTVHMSALQGTYNSKSEMLKLDTISGITSSSGYTGRLSEATVDIKKGDVLSEQPVADEDVARHARCQPAADQRIPATWFASTAASNMTMTLNKPTTWPRPAPVRAAPAAASGAQ